MPEDHDQRLKTLLKEYIGPFFELFFPDQARRFDFTGVTWLENEAFADPPHGLRQALDLVARLPLKEPVEIAPGEWTTELVAIIHIEVESADSIKPLRKRMFQYFASLRQKYAEPILPVALYLQVGLEGIGIDHYVEHFGELEVLGYHYLYVGLPALDGMAYLDRDNWLGVALAALMKVPKKRRPWFKARALKRIVTSPENEYRKHLLGDFVDVYLAMKQPEEAEQFAKLLEQDEYQEVRTMQLTWYEKGQALGRRELCLEYIAIAIAKEKGSISPEWHQTLQALPTEELDQLLKSVLAGGRILNELARYGLF